MITHEHVSGWSPSRQLGYRQEGDVLQHLALVKELASTVQPRPHVVDEKDLVQAGVVGLLDALGTYDESKHTTFWRYAKPYIVGTILDTVRQLDRARNTPVGSAPVSPNQGYSSFDTAAGYRDFHVRRQRRRMQDIADCCESQPDCICARNELSHSITRAVRSLPERHQQVIILHYVEELTLKRISAILGVSSSRVAQIRHKALLRVSAELQLFGYGPHRHVRMGPAPRRPKVHAQFRSCTS